MTVEQFLTYLDNAKAGIWAKLKTVALGATADTAAPGNHTHAAPAWGDVTGKPSSFAPTAHAASHATGGADAVTPASIGAAAVADLASTAEALALEASTARAAEAAAATAISAETARAQVAEAARADEESGTWTPTLWSQGNNVTGVTYSSGPGRYTRHGHVVSVWADIQMTSSGTGGNTGNVRLSGLPFATATNSEPNWRYTAFVYDRNLASSWVTSIGPASLVLLCEPGATVPAFMSSHSGGYLTWDYLTATTRIAFIFTYQIN